MVVLPALILPMLLLLVVVLPSLILALLPLPGIFLFALPTSAVAAHPASLVAFALPGPPCFTPAVLCEVVRAMCCTPFSYLIRLVPYHYCCPPFSLLPIQPLSHPALTASSCVTSALRCRNPYDAHPLSACHAYLFTHIPAVRPTAHATRIPY